MSNVSIGHLVRLNLSSKELSLAKKLSYKLEGRTYFRVADMQVKRLRFKNHKRRCYGMRLSCRCAWHHDDQTFLCLDGNDVWVPIRYFALVYH